MYGKTMYFVRSFSLRSESHIEVYDQLVTFSSVSNNHQTKLVKDILDTKKSIGNDKIYWISQEVKVIDALKKMNSYNIGALLIHDNQNKLVGIFTERDYLKKVILRGKHSKSTQITDVMTQNPFLVGDEVKAMECLKIMTEKRFRHLPVFSSSDPDHTVIGFISIGDLAKELLIQYKETIDGLTNFIESNNNKN